MLEKRTIGTDDSAPTLTRYVYSNHLQSASLELDGIGDIISYEEYHPYGTTAFQARNASINAVAKRYRYTGKERDEESGLYYHGARYYIPWLCRWTAIDPMESKYAGRTPYCYSANNPIIFNDPDGMQEQKGTAQVEQLGGWYKTPNGEMKFYKGDGNGNDFKASGIKGDFQGEVRDGTGKIGLHYRPDGKIEKNGLIISGGGKASSHKPSVGQIRAINPVENPKPITKEPVSTVTKSVTPKVASSSENTNSFVNWESLKGGLYTTLDIGTNFIPGSGIKDVYAGLQSGNYLQAIDGGLSITLDAMTLGYGSKIAKGIGGLLDEGVKLLSASVGLGTLGAPRTISSMSGHAVDQAITRGFKSPDILRIVREGTATLGRSRYGNAQWRYMKGGNTIVIDAERNRVITMFSNAPGTRNKLGAGFFKPF